jgi:hypothetical protein
MSNYKQLPTIPEGYELSNKGRPVNKNGRILKTNITGQVVYKNGKPMYENENNFELPQRIKQNIKTHPKSEHSYMIIKNKNKNGIEIEKFVKVNKNGKIIEDRGKYIYINKETGEAITGNGKKYVVNKLTGELVKNRNGYILNSNLNTFPQKINNQQIKQTNIN